MDELDFKEIDCNELKTVILGNYTIVMLWVDAMNTYVVGATDDDIEFMLSEDESSVRSFAYEADAIEYFKYLVKNVPFTLHSIIIRYRLLISIYSFIIFTNTS